MKFLIFIFLSANLVFGNEAEDHEGGTFFIERNDIKPYNRLPEDLKIGSEIAIAATPTPDVKVYRFELRTSQYSLGVGFEYWNDHYNSSDQSENAGSVIVIGDFGKDIKLTNRHHPIRFGQEFQATFKVLRDGKLEIIVNGQSLAAIKPRHNFQSLRQLYIWPQQRQISRIEFTSKSGSEVDGQSLNNINSQELILESGISGGQVLHISGVPTLDSRGFQIAFIKTTSAEGDRSQLDIALRININFNDNQVTRNSRIGGVWGDPEHFGGFPFEKGTFFDVAIKNDETRFYIQVNGEDLASFDHRLKELHEIKLIRVDGAISDVSIRQ